MIKGLAGGRGRSTVALLGQADRIEDGGNRFKLNVLDFND
jgi:hypothetical protein